MNEGNPPSDRLDRTVLTTAPLFDDAGVNAYWLSRTPHERLQHVEALRRMNYGDRATARLQRVLEVVQDPESLVPRRQ